MHTDASRNKAGETWHSMESGAELTLCTWKLPGLTGFPLLWEKLVTQISTSEC